jgi:hypothetical protein
MKGYEYQLVRYIHDMVTEEFVNVGIVFYVSDENYLKSRSTRRYKRVSDFFGHISGDFLISSLKHIDKSVAKAALDPKVFISHDSLDHITSAILPKNDSALQLSEIHKGITLDAQKTFESLYQRYIGVFETSAVRHTRSDDDAWRRTYKKYFDNYGITKKLKEHSIKTSIKEFKFEHSFKNHIWHCFEPVSFDLADKETITDKACRIAGKITSLTSTNEEFKLYFLTVQPDEKLSKSLNSSIEQLFKEAAHKKDQVEIINEENAENFAKKIKILVEGN